MKSICAFFKAAVVLGVIAATNIWAGVITPNTVVAGKTQAEWSAQWWQWAVSYPTSQNPLADTTRAYSYLGNQGPVFFLAGSLSSDPTVRSVTVFSNQSLFFPIINVLGFPEFSAYGGGEANLKQDARETIGIDAAGLAPNTTLFAALNGVALALPAPTTSLFDYRQVAPTSGTFPLNIPAGNPLGATPGVVTATSDGWWLMLSPLAPGNYSLRFGGVTTGLGPYSAFTFGQDNTYNITVAAIPEPSTLILLGGALLLLGRMQRRW